MLIDVSQLRTTPNSHRALVWHYPGTKLRWHGLVMTVEPALLDVALRHTPDGVSVEVQGRLTAIYPCDRCLTEHPLRVAVAYQELHATEAQASRRPVHDEDVRLVIGNEDLIALDEGLEQAVLLELPTKHLCRQDCRGLCPRCGVNRNEETCFCEPEADPRLARLAEWFSQEGNRDGKP